MDGLANKVALVTGAAGGIGSAVARALARHGARVVAVDRDSDRLRMVAKEITAAGGPAGAPVVLPLAADISAPAAVADLVERAEHAAGPIEVLVNGAGVLRPGAITDLTDAQWTETFAVNATGVFLVSRAVAAGMIRHRRGAIVTIGSNASAVPRKQMAAYSAAKAAADMFTRCLGLELAEYGIRCNVVAPGSTDTDMLRQLWRDDADRRATLDGAPQAYRLGIPLRRLARPEDVADAVLFLASDRAAHITMHHLTVDGGATLGA